MEWSRGKLPAGPLRMADDFWIDRFVSSVDVERKSNNAVHFRLVVLAVLSASSSRLAGSVVRDGHSSPSHREVYRNRHHGLHISIADV